MLENFLRARTAIERRSGGLLGPHLDSFVASLSQLGYARETVQERLRFLYVFDRWLVRQGLALVDLQDAVINNFLEEQRDKGRSRMVVHRPLATSWTTCVSRALVDLRNRRQMSLPWRRSASSMRTNSRKNAVFSRERSPITGNSPGVLSSNALGTRRSVFETWRPTTSRDSSCDTLTEAAPLWPR